MSHVRPAGLAGNALRELPTIPSRSASSRREHRQSASAIRAALISRSDSASSTASSATAPSPQSKATSSKSTSSTRAGRRCWTASSARAELINRHCASMSTDANDAAHPWYDRGPAHLLEDLDPGKIVPPPDHFARRDVQPLDEDRHVGSNRGQFVALKLQSARG